MCYFLYIASPLTLSEIRSMLPAGLTADLAPASYRSALLGLHPQARTAAQLLVGACSCDLVRPRLEIPLEDERELRSRYQRDRLPRSDIIRELEQHRRGPLPRPRAAKGWANAVADFVVEHARNAGPTLYLLDFTPHQRDAARTVPPAPLACSVEDVRREPGRWLVEGHPVIVA
jgi:hypothetical protein